MTVHQPERPRDVEEWERQPEQRTWPVWFFGAVALICLTALAWHVFDVYKRPTVKLEMSHSVTEVVNWESACIVIDPKRHYIRPAWENIVCTPENAKKQGWY